MSDFKIPIDILVYRVASRLGIIDPDLDKYFEDESPGDLKIQSFAKMLFPDDPWYLDEPLWSTGRQRVDGGHCFPRNPEHRGCIFEEICAMKHLDVDPSTIGMETGNRRARPPEAPGPTMRQKRFADFVQQLKDQGVRGEEYRRKVEDHRRENP